MSTGTSGLNVGTLDVTTASGASTAITTIDTALDTINLQRAAIGAGINQLGYAADNMTNISANVTQSRSTIMDTDYALATTQLAKTQILQQASTAMLAQANQQAQGVMALLK
jgi:flagellin